MLAQVKDGEAKILGPFTESDLFHIQYSVAAIGDLMKKGLVLSPEAYAAFERVSIEVGKVRSAHLLSNNE